MAEIVCRICGKIRTGAPSRIKIARYCSVACRKIYEKGVVTKKCELCHLEFRSFFSKKRRFCGKQCKDHYLSHLYQDKQFSVFTRDKISAALKGRKYNEEHRKKLSESHKGKYDLEKNPAWMGGISFDPYPVGWNKIFRRHIRERDQNKCQLCGRVRSELKRDFCVHHVDYDKKNINPNNLITLCLDCHLQTGFRRGYWKSMFSEMMNMEVVVHSTN